MDNDFFGDEELAQLRSHGIALFARRVVFDAQPPMTQEQIAAVQAVCSGPLPPELLALWRLTAGGRVDYDLHLRMNGNEESVGWSELFWNGSDSFHDLQGWIAHELEGAKEAAAESEEAWDGKLTLLPIGGLEDCDRIYAVVESGADYGHVLAWKQGLPAAWAHEMHEDGMTTVAHDLCAAFDALHLDEDPLEPAGEYFTGQTLLEYLDQRHQEHGLTIELMDKLIAFYRRVRPEGPGWNGIARDAGLAQEHAQGRLSLQFVNWILGCALIYGSLFGIGKLIFKEWAAGSVYLLVAIVAGVLISRNLSRGEFEVETAKLEPAEEAV